MKRMTLAAVTVVALFLLLTVGATNASADTWYCTSASSTSCSATAPSSGAYWTVAPTITLNTTLSTVDFTLSVTADNGAGGYLQDFSGQYFFNGSQLTNLTWVKNPGSWTDLEASKAGNSGSCNGNAPGSFCASSTGSTTVALTSTPVVFELTGSYTGTFVSGAYNFQIAAANNADGSGGNAFAISQTFGSPPSVPDGGMTVMLLGGALVGLEALRRRVRA